MYPAQVHDPSLRSLINHSGVYVDHASHVRHHRSWL